MNFVTEYWEKTTPNCTAILLEKHGCKTACSHRRGITKNLMFYFEDLAKKLDFKYITLGSEEDAFYEQCGYKIIFQTHGQNIYQKQLL